MIADDKFKRLLETNLRFDGIIAALVALMTASTVGLYIYVRRKMQKGAFTFNQVSPLKLDGWEVFSLIFLLALLEMQRETAILFYPATILGVVFLLRNKAELHLHEFWGVNRLKRWQIPLLSLWLCLVAFSFMTPISIAVGWLSDIMNTPVQAQDSVNLLFDSHDKFQVIWLLFSVAILAPMAEEMLFRGLLYPFFKARIPSILPLVLTSLLFALVHFDRFTFIQLFFFAMFLGSIFEHTGSLPLCIGLHMTFNICNAIWLLVLKYIP